MAADSPVACRGTPAAWARRCASTLGRPRTALVGRKVLPGGAAGRQVPLRAAEPAPDSPAPLSTPAAPAPAAGGGLRRAATAASPLRGSSHVSGSTHDRVWRRAADAWRALQSAYDEREAFLERVRERRRSSASRSELRASAPADSAAAVSSEALARALVSDSDTGSEASDRPRRVAAPDHGGNQAAPPARAPARPRSAPPVLAGPAAGGKLGDIEEVPLRVEDVGIGALRERNLAHEAFRRGRHAEARKRYARLLPLAAGSASAAAPLLVNRALCSDAEGDYAAAADDALRAAQILGAAAQPSGKARVLAARSLLLLGDCKAAREQLRLALASAGAGGGQVLAAARKQLLLADALEGHARLRGEGRFAAALSALAAAPQDDLPVQLLRADTMLQHRCSEGQQHIEQLAEQHPDNADIAFLRAKACFWMGQDGLSLHRVQLLADACLRICPGHRRAQQLAAQVARCQALRSEASLHTAARRYQLAHTAWTQLGQVDELNWRLVASAALGRAWAAQGLGAHSDAVKDCTVAIERIDRGGGEPLQMRARALLLRSASREALGDLAEAAADAEAAHLLAPSPASRRRVEALRSAADDARRWRPRRPRPNSDGGGRRPPPRRGPDADYYTVLGCHRRDSAHKVSAQYRRAALRWHPDKWTHGTEQQRQEAEERFKAVSEAHSVLADPEKRAEYDALLSPVGADTNC